MRGDILVLNAGDVALAARHMRELADEHLVDVAAIDLERAARQLRAGAYSAATAARRLDHLAKQREVMTCAETP